MSFCILFHLVWTALAPKSQTDEDIARLSSRCIRAAVYRGSFEVLASGEERRLLADCLLGDPSLLDTVA